MLIFSYTTKEVRIFLNPLSPNSCQKLAISFLHMMTTSCSSFTIFSKVPDVLSEEIESELYPPTACATVSLIFSKVQSSSENVSVNNAEEIPGLKASQSIVALYGYRLDDSILDEFIGMLVIRIFRRLFCY